jgi:multiple sugar transport system permease protein
MSAASTSLARAMRLRAMRLPWGKLLIHVTLIGGAFVMVIPFLWMLTLSLKPAALTHQPPHLIPTHFEVANYEKAWQAAPFARYYLNSIVMTAGITLGQVLLSSLAAYAFARLKFPGRDALFMVFLATMMVPFYVILIPSYLIIDWLGWIDSYAALIVPRMVSAFGIFLLRQYYRGIPRELDEAAMIDGASRLGIWWRIILPLSGPGLATLGIFAFMFAWNDFLWPLVVINDPDMRTVQLGLAMFQGRYGTQWTLLMAGTVTATLPTLLVFLIGQRWFIQNVARSGVKG